MSLIVSGNFSVRGSTVVSGKVSYPLDSYGGAGLAISVRKLVSTATYAMKVRRSNDDALLDIGFDSNGNLDTGALMSFVGANTGTVAVWYDQSGKGNDVISGTTTLSQEPIIVSGGTLLTNNGRPYVYFNGSQVRQTNVISTIGNIVDTSGNWFTISSAMNRGYSVRLIFNGITSIPGIAQMLRTNNLVSESIARNQSNFSFNDTGPSTSISVPFIMYSQRNQTSVEVFLNNSSDGATTTTGTPSTGQTSNQFVGIIGAYNVSPLDYGWIGYIQEIIHYPLNPDNYTYKNNLTNNLNAYYNVY